MTKNSARSSSHLSWLLMYERVVLVSSLAVFAAACNSSDLSRATAETQLRGSAKMRHAEEATITLGRYCAITDGDPLLVNDEGRRRAKAFQQLELFALAGLVSIKELRPGDWKRDTDYFTDMMKCNPMIGKWVVASLTPKGQEAADQLKWTKLGNDTYRVPLAVRAFNQVTGVTRSGDHDATVEYTWRWDPTPIGADIGYIPVPRKASARFRRYDDGWRLSDTGL